MLVNFQDLPETSRVWIYQCNRSFSDIENNEISQKMSEFLTSWTAHGADLKAGFEIKYKRFIVIGLDQNLQTATGCSIDASVHFIQKLESQPSIEFKCMHPYYEDLREKQVNLKFYSAWKNGQTGYPFVDACMRFLNYNGWITFRMRAMLVSFASYDLWLDWRKIGYHLAQMFTDYEPGIHYSQLQMQSGVTGINTLRIYNPIKQSYDQDPNGEFIKKWVPELKNVSEAWIHEPWKMSLNTQKSSKCIIGKDYPHKIIVHSEAIKKAKSQFTKIMKKEGYNEKSKFIFTKLGSRRKKREVLPNKQLKLL